MVNWRRGENNERLDAGRGSPLMGTSVELTCAKGGRPLRGSVAMVLLVVTMMKGLGVADGATEAEGEGKEVAETVELTEDVAEAEVVIEAVGVTEGEVVIEVLVELEGVFDPEGEPDAETELEGVIEVEGVLEGVTEREVETVFEGVAVFETVGL